MLLQLFHRLVEVKMSFRNEFTKRLRNLKSEIPLHSSFGMTSVI